MHSEYDPFRRRPETVMLIKLFRALKKKEFVSYKEIEEKLGFDPRGKEYLHLMRNAADIVSKGEPDIGEAPVLLRCIKGKGYERMEDGVAAAHTNKVYGDRFTSNTRRYRRAVDAIDPAQIKEQSEQQAYGIAVQMVGIREAIDSTEAKRKIAKKAIENKESLGMTKDETQDLLRAIAESGFKG